MKKLIILSTAIFLFNYTGAQYPRVTISGSEQRKIVSTIVSGQEYELDIQLPGNYKNSTQKYPVIYVMDAQWDFPLVEAIYGQQYYDGFIPACIIVGVTWGGIAPNPDSLRVRDYTPTNDGRQVQSGGADKFLDFMKNELFPFIESNYRADKNNRSLLGSSLGGLFALYTLFTHPGMFNGYIATAPAIGWDREVIYQYEKKYYESKQDLPARLFMTAGDVERSLPFFSKLENFMSGRHYSSLQFHSAVLKNTGHSGTKSETYTRGLQFVYEKPDLKLSDDVLHKYEGSYHSPNNQMIDLKTENHQLVLYYSGGNKYLLKASSDSSFYSVSEFLNIQFSAASTGAFQLDRYGRSEHFTKSLN